MLLPRHAPDAFAYLVSMGDGGLIRIDGNSATGKFVDEDSAATGATVVEAGEERDDSSLMHRERRRRRYLLKEALGRVRETPKNRCANCRTAVRSSRKLRNSTWTLRYPCEIFSC